ncbi:hypothetical protein SeGA_2784 [Salmonella enterica subsp. enterica serovar Gaminara str. A4-567]|nr:hypothetical protein SeGA_2784 [Salmonella enterica subsp. enterica serovar Gaminara str. A4-567]
MCELLAKGNRRLPELLAKGNRRQPQAAFFFDYMTLRS